jgi:hypothetical protein
MQMSLGLTIFTAVHVLLSLIGILAGFVVVYGLNTAKRLDGWTATFLWTTILTSVTGFLFPFHKLLPSHVLGILSLIVLAIAVFARYRQRLAAGWNRAYAISAVIALYFNVFVLVAQLFQKVPALNALAPTQSEPPFKIAQLAVLIIFVVIGILSAVRFRSEQLHAA